MEKVNFLKDARGVWQILIKWKQLIELRYRPIGSKVNTLRCITFSGSSSKPVSPGEPGLFSDMVSVPTSGKQIKDERETFKNFLQAINLMPRVAKQQDTASTFSVSTRLRYLHVHQVDGGFDNLANKGKGNGKSRVGIEEKRKGRRQVSVFTFL